MIVFIFLALTVIHSTTAFRLTPTGCSFTALNNNPKKDAWPIFTKNSQFIYADPGQKDIKINQGDNIEVVCSGGKLKDFNLESVSFTCKAGNIFSNNEKQLDFTKKICNKEITHSSRKTENPCEENGDEVEIGFTKVDGFIRQIRLCFNPQTQLALYSDYTVSRSLWMNDLIKKPTTFTKDSFYEIGGKDIDDLYSIKTQRRTINSLLGLKPEDNNKYIKDEYYYLSRGHFAARNEFIYGIQQRATYHYVNVAPQWQLFNDKNWNTVEWSIKNFVRTHKFDLKIYTGTWGNTKLLNNKNVLTPLYLYVNGDQKALPVPDLYWKAVYHTVIKKAVVIFGVNNPYKTLDDIKAHSVICKDVLPEIKWLTFDDAQNITEGYMYACSFADAKKIINYLPDWEVTGLFI